MNCVVDIIFVSWQKKAARMTLEIARLQKSMADLSANYESLADTKDTLEAKVLTSRIEFSRINATMLKNVESMWKS